MCESVVFSETAEKAKEKVEQRPNVVNVQFVKPAPPGTTKRKPIEITPPRPQLALPAPRNRQALDQAAIQRGIAKAESEFGKETRDFDRTLFALSELAKSRGVDVPPRDVANDALGRLTSSLKPSDITAEKVKAGLTADLRDTERDFKGDFAFKLTPRFSDFPANYNPLHGKAIAQNIIERTARERKLRKNTKAYKAFLESNESRIAEIEKSAQKEHAQEWLEKAVKHLREQSQSAIEDEQKLRFAERRIGIAKAFDVPETAYDELPKQIKAQRQRINGTLRFLQKTIKGVSQETGVKPPKFVKPVRTDIMRRLGIGARLER